MKATKMWVITGIVALGSLAFGQFANHYYASNDHQQFQIAQRGMY
ncbi:hypothetical protein [Bacillus sp. PM43]